MDRERPGDGKERRARELHASGKGNEFTGIVLAETHFGVFVRKHGSLQGVFSLMLLRLGEVGTCFSYSWVRKTSLC